MGKENKISIIVPAYNVEKYIEACIDSVKKQTCQDFECVIVDDGSTDDTLMIIQNMVEGDRRFKVYHQENLGVSEARNTAISHATGEYLMFLDGDDLLQEDAVSIVKRDIEVDEKEYFPDVIVYPTISYFERLQPDGTAKTIMIPKKCCLNKLYYTGTSALKECLYNKNFMFAVWQTVVKRSYIKKNSYGFKKGIVHEDELWLTRIIGNAQNVQMGSEPYYFNRECREGGITQSHNIQKEFDKCTIIEELQRDIEGAKSDNKSLIPLLQEKCAQLEFNMITKYNKYVDDDYDKSLLKKIKANRNKLFYSSRYKHKVMCMLSYVVNIRLLSKMICYTIRKRNGKGNAKQKNWNCDNI